MILQPKNTEDLTAQRGTIYTNIMEKLTKQDFKDILTLLNRVPLTGTNEAVALIKIVQKIENELQDDTNK